MDYERLLCQYDDPMHWEYPPAFDCQLAVRRFARFVDELSSTLNQNIRFETGAQIQDASFHSQIFLEAENKQFAVIRFSHFGDMVTVGNEEALPRNISALLQSKFSENGYIYVPEKALYTPYISKNAYMTGIDSWWVRYLDWL